MENKRHIPQPSLSVQSDQAAENEARLFENGDYDKIATRNKHRRDERVKWHMGLVAILLFWLVVIAIIFIGFSWLWSILAPASWQYLSDVQLSEARTILTSALLVKVISEFTKRNF
jgi:hypothetical protein